MKEERIDAIATKSIKTCRRLSFYRQVWYRSCAAGSIMFWRFDQYTQSAVSLIFVICSRTFLRHSGSTKGQHDREHGWLLRSCHFHQHGRIQCRWLRRILLPSYRSWSPCRPNPFPCPTPCWRINSQFSRRNQTKLQVGHCPIGFGHELDLAT